MKSLPRAALRGSKGEETGAPDTPCFSVAHSCLRGVIYTSPVTVTQSGFPVSNAQPETKKGICQPALAGNSKQAFSGCWLSEEECGVRDLWGAVGCLSFCHLPPSLWSKKKFCLCVTRSKKDGVVSPKARALDQLLCLQGGRVPLSCRRKNILSRSFRLGANSRCIGVTEQEGFPSEDLNQILSHIANIRTSCNHSTKYSPNRTLCGLSGSLSSIPTSLSMPSFGMRVTGDSWNSASLKG